MNIIKAIYWMNLTIMKKILSLYEYKVGRDTDEYKYFKKEVMDYFYNELHKFYETLVKAQYAEKCNCDSKLRKGYNKCDLCGGSGYKPKP